MATWTAKSKSSDPTYTKKSVSAGSPTWTKTTKSSDPTYAKKSKS